MIKSFFQNYFSQLIVLILGLAQTKILTNFLTIENYGAFSAFTATYLFFFMIFSFNLGNSIIRFASGKINRISSLYWSCITLGSKIFVVLFIIATICSCFGLIDFWYVVIVLIAGTANIFLALSKSVIICFEDFKFLAIFNFVSKVVLLSLILVYVYIDIYIYYIILVIPLAFLLSLSIFYYKYKTKLKPININSKALKILVLQGTPLIGSSLFYWFIFSGSKLIISTNLGNIQNGYFTVILLFPNLLLLLYSTISALIFNYLSKYYNSNNQIIAEKLLSLSISLFYYAFLLISLLIVLNLNYLLPLISKKEYLIPNIHTSVFCGLSVVTIYVIFMQIQRLYDLNKLNSRALVINVICVIISFTISIVVVNKFNFVGVILANLFSVCLGTIFMIFDPKIKNKIRIKISHLLMVSLIFCIISFYYSKLDFDSYYDIVFSILITIIYSFVIYHIMKNDFNTLSKLINTNDNKNRTYKN